MYWYHEIVTNSQCDFRLDLFVGSSFRISFRNICGFIAILVFIIFCYWHFLFPLMKITLLTVSNNCSLYWMVRCSSK